MRSLELGAWAPTWLWDVDASELRDWAQGVEAIGYHWLVTPDHLLFEYPQGGRAAPRYPYPGGTIQQEALTSLAYMAGLTSRIILQTGVTPLPQRDPVVLAKQAAQLDVLSGGRFRLGVGLGWQPAASAALGAPAGETVSRFEEAVALLRACWREEPVSFHGRHWRLDGMSMLPKPLTPGGPAILYGGDVPAAEERAARHCDGWVGIGIRRIERVREQVERLRSQVSAAGRDPERFRIQWHAPLSDDLGALAKTFIGYREAGVWDLSVGMPELPAGERLSVDEYLGGLEAVWREVWPGVVGG